MQRIEVVGYHIAVSLDPKHRGRWIDALKVVASIKRHIDGIEAVSTVDDKLAVCEYCKSPWTAKTVTGNLCCAKDEEEHDEIGQAG